MRVRCQLSIRPRPRLAVLAAVGILMCLAPFASTPLPVKAQPANIMAVDADPGTAAIDSARSVTSGATFDVSINVAAAGAAYVGYQFSLRWDAAVLAFVSGAHLSDAAGFTFCNLSFFQEDPSHVAFFCAGAPTNYVGQHDRLTFQCVGTGATTLHLESSTEGSGSGTYTVSEDNLIETGTQDAQIGCGVPVEVPTPTPTGTGPTPAPTPTPPVGPGATATPPPPGLEAVSLVEGCQFVAWTGADGTSPDVLASQVEPAGSLRSFWAQQPAPTWRGYSPEFPQVSDMTPVNMLDVVAICMDGAGAFLRPLV